MIWQERFWSKVDKSADGCWLWGAAAFNDGYGAFWLDGQNRHAHRVAYLIAYGRWPMPCCLHSCDDRLCVNPQHLRSGTYADNSADAVIRGRLSSGPAHGVLNAPSRAKRWVRDKRFGCITAGCTRNHYAHGLCKACYERERKSVAGGNYGERSAEC